MKKLSLNALTGNRWRFVTVALIVVLVAVSFYALYKPGTGVSAQPNFLNVALSGPAKLSPQEVGQYVASVNNSYSDNLEYTWSISPSDNKTLLTPMGKTCNLTFLAATGDFYRLCCTAKDSMVGNQGFGFVDVQDPYTLPNLYLGAYGAPYSYLIESDGLGWYQAVNGVTGQISSSIDASAVIQATLTVLETSGGKLFISKGLYMLTVGLTYAGVVGTNELIIEGEGTQTILDTTNAIIMLKLTGGSHYRIRDLYFQGSSTVGVTGIELLDCSEEIIENVAFAKIAGTAINVRGSWGNWIRDCYFWGCGDEATTKPVVSVTGGVTHAHSEAIKLLNCLFDDTNYYHIIHGDLWDYMILIDGCRIGISSGTVGNLINLDGVTNIQITNCMLDNARDTESIVLTETGGGTSPERVLISGNHFQRGSTQIVATGRRVIINNNDFDYASVEAINYSGTGVVTITSNVFGFMYYMPTAVDIETGTYHTVSNNIFAATNPATALTAVKIASGCDYTKVVGNSVVSWGIGVHCDADGVIITSNQIYACTTGILLDGDQGIVQQNSVQGGTTKIDDNGSGNHVCYNKGYLTENAGYATILNTNTSVVVPHGCSYTPRSYDITLTLANEPSNDLGNFHITTIDDTNFTIVASNPGVNTAVFAWTVRKTY